MLPRLVCTWIQTKSCIQSMDAPLSPPESTVPLPIISSSSPHEAPAFQDPLLLTALSIFYDKTHISPSTLALDSIRFKNVTIKKSKKPPLEDPGATRVYTPLSTRLKNAARQTRISPVPSQVLRESTPAEPVSP